MPELAYFLTIGLLFGTILLVFAMRSLSAIQQAKARLSREEDYRVLAQKAVASESDKATALSSIASTLAEVSTRLSAIEKILKEVE
jgi:hypothetical protein